MFKEAIDRIAELGVQASGIEVQSLCNRKHLVRKGNAFEVMEFDPPERSYVAFNCTSFVHAVTTLCDDPVVAVGAARVIGRLDEQKREGKVVMDLPPSRAMDALKAIGSPTEQRRLVAYLREELSGCVDPRFLAVVRRLDFSRRNDGVSHLQHGRESLGRSVEAAVQSSEGDVPETIVVELPAWGNIQFDSKIQVRCAVSVDPVGEKITVRPIGDDLSDQIQGLRDKLMMHLYQMFSHDGHELLVFCGELE